MFKGFSRIEIKEVESSTTTCYEVKLPNGKKKYITPTYLVQHDFKVDGFKPKKFKAAPIEKCKEKPKKKKKKKKASMKDLEELIDIQCDDGNWNYDPYMQGMANGMILSKVVVEDCVEEPKFLEAPEKWLKDKDTNKKAAQERVLVIDDQRSFAANYTAKNYFDGIDQLKNHGPWDLLLLDHDLASYDESGREKTGYDVMCWLEQNTEYLPKKIKLVTSNPVGRQRMRQVIDKLYSQSKKAQLTLSFTPEEQKIIDIMKEAGEALDIEIWLAGGIVRDKLLGEESSDLDFMCEEGSKDVALYLVGEYNIPDPVVMDKSKALLLRINGQPIDLIDSQRVVTPLTHYMKSTLEQGQEMELSISLDDAYRRDLTINALLYNVQTEEIEDPTGKGLQDLKNKIIRTIIDPYSKYRIHAPDMLRALRFYAIKEGFQFAPEMLEAMTENASKVKPRNEGGDISSRRIERELRKAIDTREHWERMKGALINVGLNKYIQKQIDNVEEDIAGEIEYEWGKELKKEAQSPQIEIDPLIKHEIQDAVAEIMQTEPMYFKNVSKIVALRSGPFGQVSSEDPSIIHLNVSRIKQEVQRQFNIAKVNMSDPQHRELFEEGVKKALVETITHERGHVETWDEAQHQFMGGESPAKTESTRMEQRMFPKSSLKGFCKQSSEMDGGCYNTLGNDISQGGNNYGVDALSIGEKGSPESSNYNGSTTLKRKKEEIENKKKEKKKQDILKKKEYNKSK